MKRSRLTWYLLAALLALVPVGVRVMTWQVRSQPVDPAMARAGEELFRHEWKAGDPLTPDGDGLGPVFNATSCLACHKQGGPGGSGGLESNVTIFTVRVGNRPTRQGVVHAHAVRHQETLRDVHPQLPEVTRPSLALLVPLSDRGHGAISFPPGVHVSQRNTPALFGAKLIDDLPDRVILAQERVQWLRWGLASHRSEHLPVGRASRLPDGRVGKFGWKGQVASLADFVQAACANELGLGNPGQAQPTPLGKPDYRAPGLDLTLEQCDQLTAFVASLPRPVEQPPQRFLARGDSGIRQEIPAWRRLFHKVGCADCHTPDLGAAEGIYSDLLLHRMGQELQGGGSYDGPPVVPVPDTVLGEDSSPSEWRTPPLWGVADSAPYLHDGRAATLEEAIRLHGGQGARSASRFAALTIDEKAQLIAFLKTLRAP